MPEAHRENAVELSTVQVSAEMLMTGYRPVINTSADFQSGTLTISALYGESAAAYYRKSLLRIYA